MKITRIGRPIPLLSTSVLGDGGGISGGNSGGTGFPGPGSVPTASGSNTWAWGSNVASITVNGTTTVLGSYVNIANGSNTVVTVDMVGAAASNTIRVHSSGGASFGSNATHVAEISSGGASSDSARMDHYHAGIATVTASSSNTMQRGTFNLRSGNNISFGLTDSDGDGEFDTVTINGAAGGGGSLTVADEGTPLATAATTLDFVGSGVTASGTGATKTITIAGGGGAASAAAIDRWHISAYTSTNSYNTTITAASSGQRIIYAVNSYGRDVNTPTCTNVTFTEVLGVANGTNCYLSIYVGVVAGGSSGTTINVTAGTTNYIFATAIIIDDALTPTAVDTASATTANTVMAVDCSVGDMIIMGWATDNATNGPTHPHPLEATTPLFLGPIDNTDSLNGLYVAVGLATITHVVGYYGRGGSGNQVGGIVAVS